MLIVTIVFLSIILLGVYRLYPVRIIPRSIVWSVDLRLKMPAVYEQKTGSCGCCAAAAILIEAGKKPAVTDPDEWLKEIGTSDGLTISDIYFLIKGIAHYNTKIVQKEDIVKTISGGQPVLVSLQSLLHTASKYVKGVSLERQNLGKLYKYVSPAKKSSHAVVIIGISNDNNYLLVRDSNGEGIGDRGHWVFPTKLLLENITAPYSLAIDR